jgi:hypothetical protein
LLYPYVDAAPGRLPPRGYRPGPAFIVSLKEFFLPRPEPWFAPPGLLKLWKIGGALWPSTTSSRSTLLVGVTDGYS